MTGRSPGSILRELEQAQSAMRKARGMVNDARAGSIEPESAARLGWESLRHAARLIAEIPFDAVDESVLMKQIAVQRYATSLLVRIRRLLRGSSASLEDELGVDDED
jgi:hypothetical protein